VIPVGILTVLFKLFLIMKVQILLMFLLLWGKFMCQSACRIRIEFFTINF